ncbi:NDMA-dependent alcohol dehydrogenase, Rxyl_3153 family protein [Mycolicibacterium hassiacum DSM 44199]|jgi:S-(hydroxymethyl)glutathione dehydrogenase/alcohol dehydrogenase|uniref:alcohol dehydrogenase n=1 Tax=Mycolicibacterium hassiacum (strain DSM 44199 / CIP 105218 / JCM 12690 / 3849) TaxID=1122247 RepID=K5BKC6_MYCHD|nr:NDMA-dependent alcohol dehydrogenase [Mycolicibacterium hassiacum]EKF24629.1 NDMA-dependent alcohol dehydrogenase, Rxyl_3153 family protein [Mycolicibacterium hassiacum DSM 44199]MBX5485042.1 NDMA-dependent alcohol dehydrogenase [Mycolicibacterium hassiacum]MDA4084401.1 alcohol dehydrogenase [Mycolicibacterium hassiacum DSM 44199]PZN19553.1 MAG: NDMA-dependent alcohol dehydrogenase [Mycolicibacterium hassiacum]VCT88918.1 NDMA-dependent alcohol dehydrogenase [Mycolicibacterium hassiacum DSM 
MKTKAAVLFEFGKPWSIEEVELDPPKAGEVLVAWEASGLCHSDEHLRLGDLGGPLPEVAIIGGHEGAGRVVEVGPGVQNLREGDHVVASFLPACGRCHFCATGQSNLCDLGALLMTGTQTDGTFRRRINGKNVGAMCFVGSFSQYGAVPEASVVKIDDDIPLSRACLLGCGITTGWGSAVNTAKAGPGQTVVVLGCGGIGSGAIQGARIAGAEHIVAVDIVEAKREKALQYGATHFVTSIEEATALVADLTRGVMADSAILCVGVLQGAMIEPALNLVRKGGAVVMTAIAPLTENQVTMTMGVVTLFQKRVLGSLYGEANPRADIPRLLRLYRDGQLMLDEVVTAEYRLDEVTKGYDDMLAGRNIRGVMIHEH